MWDDLTGKYVRSVKVGRKQEFNGVVIERHPGSGWTVESLADGGHWHRERSELTVIPKPRARRKAK